MNAASGAKAIGLSRLAATVLIVAGFLGCNRHPSTRIAILQDKPQEWADALKLGFGDGMRAAGMEADREVVLVTLSSAGDPQGLTGLVAAVEKQDYALVYALGTQVSQEAFRSIKSKPLIFGAVTDPVKAGFYDGSLTKPLGNITGTQDLWPYSAQFDLILHLVPNARKIGVLYNSSEINSQVSVGLIRAECVKRGLTLDERTVTEESQVSLATSALIASGISVLFIPADNTAQTSSQVIIAQCLRSRIPVFTGIPGIVESGALGTVGTNYYDLGKLNAEQAAQVLQGKPAKDIPVAVAMRGDIYLNLGTARKLGIAVDPDLVRRAIKIYE